VFNPYVVNLACWGAQTLSRDRSRSTEALGPMVLLEDMSVDARLRALSVAAWIKQAKRYWATYVKETKHGKTK
jgi:hypothetical protein